MQKYMDINHEPPDDTLLSGRFVIYGQSPWVGVGKNKSSCISKDPEATPTKGAATT